MATAVADPFEKTDDDLVEAKSTPSRLLNIVTKKGAKVSKTVSGHAQSNAKDSAGHHMSSTPRQENKVGDIFERASASVKTTAIKGLVTAPAVYGTIVKRKAKISQEEFQAFQATLKNGNDVESSFQRAMAICKQAEAAHNARVADRYARLCKKIGIIANEVNTISMQSADKTAQAARMKYGSTAGVAHIANGFGNSNNYSNDMTYDM